MICLKIYKGKVFSVFRHLKRCFSIYLLLVQCANVEFKNEYSGVDDLYEAY